MVQPTSSDHTATSPPASAQEAFAESVERARTGDPQAFRDLFDSYYGPICTYLAHLVRNTEVGHDLAQETFLRAWKGLQRARGEMAFRPWLYRIATNVARSYLQRERLISWLPWFNSSSSPPVSMQAVNGPEALLEEQEFIAEILATLPQQSRTCLLLQHVAGFSQLASPLTAAQPLWARH